MEILNDKIDKWNNIDKGYINYMRSIGIYEQFWRYNFWIVIDY